MEKEMNNGYKMQNPQYLSKLNTIQELVEQLNAKVIVMQAIRAGIDSDKYLLESTYGSDEFTVAIRIGMDSKIKKQQETLKTNLQEYKQTLQALNAIIIEDKEI